MTSRWTIATAIVAGIILSLFVSYIAGFLGYSFAILFNVTSTIHYTAMQALHKVDPNVTVAGNETIELGNYTGVLNKPSQSLFQQIIDALMPVMQILLKIITTPAYLAIVVAVAIIITVYMAV
ncbi:MAG: hypothetical protein GXO43_05905 [Crenarchaeota archaeon]|nr:hypothetical protein [Thermoproteota archaeon]